MSEESNNRLLSVSGQIAVAVVVTLVMIPASLLGALVVAFVLWEYPVVWPQNWHWSGRLVLLLGWWVMYSALCTRIAQRNKTKG